MAELTRPPKKSSNGYHEVSSSSHKSTSTPTSQARPIHIPRRTLSQVPDPMEPAQTPPNSLDSRSDDFMFRAQGNKQRPAAVSGKQQQQQQQQYPLSPQQSQPEFRSTTIASGGISRSHDGIVFLDPVKAHVIPPPKHSHSLEDQDLTKAKANADMNTQPIDMLRVDSASSLAARKKQAEKEKHISIKEARKLKRESQEHPTDYILYDDNKRQATEDEILFLPPPATTLTREISTSSTAARPFDEGCSDRVLQELMALEHSTPIGEGTISRTTTLSSEEHTSTSDNASLVGSPSCLATVKEYGSDAESVRKRQCQVAVLLDSTCKKGLYHQKKKLILRL